MPPPLYRALSVGKYSRSFWRRACQRCAHNLHANAAAAAAAAAIIEARFTQKDTTNNKTCSKPQAELKHFSAQPDDVLVKY